MALDVLGYKLVRDVAPGEAIFVDLDGNFYSRQCAPIASLNPCIFEYVYLARPDSVIDGISVYDTRLRMGESLAEKIRREHADLDIDVVIPIPDSSRPSAVELAKLLGVSYREGFIKNRYIGRTFIMPGQAMRKKSVRQKLNAIGREFKGKNVLLVDDSIVRGTTSREIVQMAREAGAQQGVLRLGLAAGALPQRLRHRHALGPRAHRHRPHARRDRPRDRRRLPHLPGSRCAGRTPCARSIPRSRASRPPASAASTSPATSRPSIWPASRPSATISRSSAAPAAATTQLDLNLATAD